jgi:hypothetical protein
VSRSCRHFGGIPNKEVTNEAMNVRNIALLSSALIACVAGSYFAARAQGPLYDQVTVDLPYSVTVNNTVLQPGHYVIRQMPSADISNRVLQIYSNDGMKLETAVMTIPALDNNTPNNTEVILHHFGDDYYFDKVWIQGKNYGYEFVLPASVKARERERQAAVNVPAAYESAPGEKTGSENQPMANAVPSPAATPPAETPAPAAEAPPAEPAPALNPAPAPSAASSDAQSAGQEPAEHARPAPEQTASPDPSLDETGGRDRKMPDTAANWVTWLLSGGGLSGAGIMLRRWARSYC